MIAIGNMRHPLLCVLLCLLFIAPATTQRAEAEASWFEKGYEAVKGERWEQAVEYNSRAIDDDSTNSMAFNNRGFAYSMLKQYSKAIEDLDKAISLDPANKLALNNRAQVRIDSSDF